jgi:pyridoxal phosphate enzyme (YggS family)
MSFRPAEGPAERLERVRDRIAKTLVRAGRRAGSVRLVIVTKGVEAERIRRLIDEEPLLLGENRVQEAIVKQRTLEEIAEVRGKIAWHLIGSLQRNKVKEVIGRFDLIHSVDSLPLAREIDSAAARSGAIQPVLLQVNLAGEKTKHGFSPEEIDAALEEAQRLPHLGVRGVMTIPPAPRKPEDSRPYFRSLREIAVRNGLAETSMGMSADFEVAVEEGATLVRVGRAVFGERL